MQGLPKATALVRRASGLDWLTALLHSHPLEGWEWGVPAALGGNPLGWAGAKAQTLRSGQNTKSSAKPLMINGRTRIC
jgi:hypothetical protein